MLDTPIVNTLQLQLLQTTHFNTVDRMDKQQTINSFENSGISNIMWACSKLTQLEFKSPLIAPIRQPVVGRQDEAC